MKVTLESTTKIVFLDGVKCRVWEGHSESGIPVHCYIPRVALSNNESDPSQFEAELLVQRPPSLDIAGIPLRLIL